MTFKSLISNAGSAQSSFLDPIYDSGYKDLKRGDYSHGWKSGHKGNSALNAITLLAFLFFLNILQVVTKTSVEQTINQLSLVVCNSNAEEETENYPLLRTTHSKFQCFYISAKSCLRDNLVASQGPIVIVVNTETETTSNTTRTTTRTKRSTTNNDTLSKSVDPILLNDASKIAKGFGDKLKP